MTWERRVGLWKVRDGESGAEETEEWGSVRLATREGRTVRKDVIYILKQAGGKGEGRPGLKQVSGQKGGDCI